MHHLEQLLGRKLNWIVCNLHTNELPLRHLIMEIDGKTMSKNRWTGPLGKMLDNVTDLAVAKKIKHIEAPQLPILQPQILLDLSTDQAYAYKIHEGIRIGHISTSLTLLEIGPVSHSRWLTTTLRFLRLWISTHELKGKDLQNLKKIVEYIMVVYIPTWFTIKIKHH